MCDSCGCGDHELVPVDLHQRILAGNDKAAAHNRGHFRAAGVVAINLMGAPGAGKTAVLEATARALPGRRIVALAGDLATDNDAVRLRASGITASAITTGSACHLDAQMVHKALHEAPWRTADYLFIENVGNLVCPAIYDLGQAANVVALSVTEGEDKPLKYPSMFFKSELMVLNKTDLLPYVPFEVEKAVDNAQRVHPDMEILEVSCLKGSGLTEWMQWLARRRDTFRAARAAPVASE